MPELSHSTQIELDSMSHADSFKDSFIQLSNPLFFWLYLHFILNSLKNLSLDGFIKTGDADSV